MRKLVALAVLGLLAVGCTSTSSSKPSQPGSGDDGSFCSLLIAFRADTDTLDAEMDSGDPTRVKNAVARLEGQVDLLQQKSPAGIAADVATVKEFVGRLQDYLAKYGYDINAITANTTATEEFGQVAPEGLESAQAQLEAYAVTTCGESVVTSTTI